MVANPRVGARPLARFDDDEIHADRQLRHGLATRQPFSEQPPEGGAKMAALAIVECLLRGRSCACLASGPRRPRASSAGPGRSPRGRAHGDRCGHSGRERSSLLRSAAPRRGPRRCHPLVAPSFGSGRRVGRPREDRASGLSSGAQPALNRRSPRAYEVASSSDSRSARSSAASSAMTGRYSRSSSSWVEGEAAGSPSRSRSS